MFYSTALAPWRTLRLVGLFFCCVFWPGLLRAQNTLSVSTPTPQAAALAKFSETPVSLYTGIPSISIPIYEIKLRGLTLPISLNYHAGGIRVSEVASSVGLGWALQAGGSISSTVMGRDDFSSTGYASTFKIPTNRRLMPLRNNVHNNDYEFCRLATGTPVAGTPSWGLLESGFDTQPDLFYYNFCGRSGKFFHTQNQTAHTIPFEPIVINRDRDQGYSITDETGNTYFFNNIELASTTITRRGGVPSRRDENLLFSKVYYLSRVVTPYHETITLAYDTIAYDYGNLGNRTRYITINSQVGSNPESCPDLPETSTENFTRVAGLQIASIRSSRGDYVQFEYSSCQRLDLHKSRALKQIKVHTGSNVRTFALGFSYFNLSEATSDCDWPASISSADSYRLKLTSVTEVGKPSYKIKYNSRALPTRQSQAQDHWGFYNSIGTGLLPAEPSVGFTQGSDRTPDAAAMQVGIIKSLQYPTGGRTEFVFEPNTYYSAADSTSYNSTVIGVSFRSHDGRDTVFGPSHRIIRSDTFTIPRTVHPLSIQVSYKTGCGSNENLATPQFSPVLRSLSDNLTTIPFNPSPTAPLATTQFHRLAPGKYVLTTLIQGNCPDDFFQLQWTQTNTIPTLTHTPLAGGLRVREVRDYASGGSVPMRRRYQYCEPTDTARSSGRVLYQPKYSYQRHDPKWSPINPGTRIGYCNYMVQSSSSVQPLSAVQGGSVAYTSIQVLKDSKGEQGMTAHTFSWADDTGPYDGYPFTPKTSLDWQRGLPLQTTDYSYNTATASYQPIHKVKNTYRHNYTPPGLLPGGCEDCETYLDPTQPNETHALGLNIIAERPETFTFVSTWAPPALDPAQFLVEAYKYVSVWSYLTEKEEYFYSPTDTTKYQVTKTFYKYDNPSHAQLSRTQTLTSAGDTLTTQQLYPLDYASSASTDAAATGIYGLKLRHMLTTVVEQQQWLRKGATSYVLGGRLSHFREGLPSQDLTLQVASPVAATAFASSTISAGKFYQDRRYRPALAYEQYDGLGNILQARQAQAPAQSFLWGYSATQPIAKAFNAEYNQLAYTSFEVQSPGRWLYAPEQAVAGGHAGRWCYSLLSPVSCDSLPAGTYQLSFWASAQPAVYHNGTLVTTAQLGSVSDATGLQHYTYTLALPNRQNEVRLEANRAIRLDELLLHPVGAQVTTYTHDPLVGITSQTDAAGRTTTYEYDALDRLQRIRDERGNILTQQEYHYARP